MGELKLLDPCMMISYSVGPFGSLKHRDKHDVAMWRLARCVGAWPSVKSTRGQLLWNWK